MKGKFKLRLSGIVVFFLPPRETVIVLDSLSVVPRVWGPNKFFLLNFTAHYFCLRIIIQTFNENTNANLNTQFSCIYNCSMGLIHELHFGLNLDTYFQTSIPAKRMES